MHRAGGQDAVIRDADATPVVGDLVSDTVPVAEAVTRLAPRPWRL